MEEMMKIIIKRFPPHQNAKVFAVLTAITSLVFLVPMAIVMSLTFPEADQQGNPINFPFGTFLLMPILYLVLGYISAFIGASIYNYLYGLIGGLEFETPEKEEA